MGAIGEKITGDDAVCMTQNVREVTLNGVSTSTFR